MRTDLERSDLLSREAPRSGSSEAQSRSHVVAALRAWHAGLPGWVTGSMIAAAIFVASRFVMWGAAYCVHVVDPSLDTFSLSMGWDAGWYLGVAENGYPTSVPPGTGPDAQTNLVFFPAYPLAMRAVSGIFAISIRQAALIVTLVTGLIGSVLFWHLANRFTDRASASRALSLMVFFPAAYVLSMGYAEAMFIMFAAGSLLALVHERWATAGICAALAGATRLHGLALALACAWAAYQAIRTRRDWRSLTAPALAPMGTIAFMAYQWVHTGSPFSWIESQRRGWYNKASATEFFEQVGRLFTHDRYGDFTLWQGGIGVIFVALGVALLIAWRPPAILTAYTVGVMVPTVMAGLLTPRYYMVVLPLFIAIGRAVKGGLYHALLGMSATMMAMLWVVISLTNVTVP